MSALLRAQAVDREQLTLAFTNINRAALDISSLEDVAVVRIPERGGVIGYWGEYRDDPFPDFLIVRDDDFKDTFSWLSSYFSGVAPITQWCRVLRQSDLKDLSRFSARPTVGTRLGAWVGAVLAECSAQAHHNINLKDLPGTAALTSGTFAAARAVAIRGEDTDLTELARRHEELNTRLREGGRPVVASVLLPIWHTIQNKYFSKVDMDRRALEPIAAIIDRATSRKEIDSEFTQETVQNAASYFDLPELAGCARGPQLDRLKSLDNVARQLGSATGSPAVQALLGFGASLIDPGASVLPELLRKYLGTFPLAPIWLGVFAGVWAPIRVFSDHSGLGRIVAKSILAESDLRSKPSCDIAFEEVSRWLGPNSTLANFSIRGMAARSINVELVYGVTSPFAIGRVEQHRVEASSSSAVTRDAQEAARLRQPPPATQNSQTTAKFESLARRIEQVEKTVTQIQQVMSSLSAGPTQPDLLGDTPGKASDTKSSKKSRWRRT
jgi:hypothetical protein